MVRQRKHRVDILEDDVEGIFDGSSLARSAADVHHANLGRQSRGIDRRDVHLLADALGARAIAEGEIQQRAFLRSAVHLPGLVHERRRRLRQPRRQSAIRQPFHATYPLRGEHRVDIADEIHTIDQRVIPRRRLGVVPKRRRLPKPRAKRRGVLGVEDEVQPPRALANPGRVAPLNLERVIARIVTQHPARRPRELAVLREVSGPRADAGRRRVVPRAAPRHARFRRFEFEFRVVEELQRRARLLPHGQLGRARADEVRRLVRTARHPPERGALGRIDADAARRVVHAPLGHRARVIGLGPVAERTRREDAGVVAIVTRVFGSVEVVGSSRGGGGGARGRVPDGVGASRVVLGGFG